MRTGLGQDPGLIPGDHLKRRCINQADSTSYEFTLFDCIPLRSVVYCCMWRDSHPMCGIFFVIQDCSHSFLNIMYIVVSLIRQVERF